MVKWVLKTEPGEYSFEDLTREGETVWSGISSPAAVAHLRRARKGDRAYLYHTGTERAIVGVVRITSDPYEDPEQPGVNRDGLPLRPVVRLKAMARVPRPLSLAAIKDDKRLSSWALVKQGRLSVVPVPAEISAILERLTGA